MNIRHRDEVDNAQNDVFSVKSWSVEHQVVIQTIDRDSYCTLLFNLVNYYFGPEFANEPFFRQLTADIIEV